MTKDIVSAITNKLIQYITMEKIHLPDFLNTIEKYNKVVCETNTIKKYEDIFYALLEDKKYSFSRSTQNYVPFGT